MHCHQTTWKMLQVTLNTTQYYSRRFRKTFNRHVQLCTQLSGEQQNYLLTAKRHVPFVSLGVEAEQHQGRSLFALF